MLSPLSNETTEAELEEALRRAAEEPANRPEFYEKLLKSNAYVLGFGGDDREGSYVAETDTKISIKNWQRDNGDPIIPFFSSLDELRRSIDYEESYLRVPVRSLFELTEGSYLILNPHSAHGKEFFPNEVSTLLTDGINYKSESHIVDKETEVILGEPVEYPMQLVESLTLFFEKHSEIDAAYLAQMHYRELANAPSILIGVEGKGDLDEIIRQAGMVISSDIIRPGEYVDFVRINPDTKDFSQYFYDSSKPFFKRTLLNRLKSVFKR